MKIQPRPSANDSPSHATAPPETPEVVVLDLPGGDLPLCGISLLERLLRSLARCGRTRIFFLTDRAERLPDDRGLRWARPGLDVEVRSRPPGPATWSQVQACFPRSDPPGPVLVLAGNRVFDRRLLETMLQGADPCALVDTRPPELARDRPETDFGDSVANPGWRRREASLAADGSPVDAAEAARAPGGLPGGALLCGAVRLAADWEGEPDRDLFEQIRRQVAQGRLRACDVDKLPTYTRELRRELRPYWFPAPGPARVKAARRVLLDAAQKGAQDLPAYLHAPIETGLVSLLCETRLTPNQLTLICNLAAWCATGLFLAGRLGWGVLLAAAVGVLDGLDGKQARVKVETSPAGKLEHLFDFFFEASWACALAFSLHRAGVFPEAARYLLLLGLAEGADALLRLTALRRTGREIDEASWFERLVRLVGGRRNVYIWIMAVGVWRGDPAGAFRTAAWWEVVTATLHLLRLPWIRKPT